MRKRDIASKSGFLKSFFFCNTQVQGIFLIREVVHPEGKKGLAKVISGFLTSAGV